MERGLKCDLMGSMHQGWKKNNVFLIKYVFFVFFVCVLFYGFYGFVFF